MHSHIEKIEVIFRYGRSYVLVKINISLRTTDSTKIVALARNEWENHIPNRDRILNEVGIDFLNGAIDEECDEGDLDETNMIFTNDAVEEDHAIAPVSI